MEYIALLTLGIFPILLAILGLILAVIWIILPFYLLALCHRVARLEWYLADLHRIKDNETTNPQVEQ
jgi:hypothetical protein